MYLLYKEEIKTTTCVYKMESVTHCLTYRFKLVCVVYAC